MAKRAEAAARRLSRPVFLARLGVGAFDRALGFLWRHLIAFSTPIRQADGGFPAFARTASGFRGPPKFEGVAVALGAAIWTVDTDIAGPSGASCRPPCRSRMARPPSTPPDLDPQLRPLPRALGLGRNCLFDSAADRSAFSTPPLTVPSCAAELHRGAFALLWIGAWPEAGRWLAIAHRGLATPGGRAMREMPVLDWRSLRESQLWAWPLAKAVAAAAPGHWRSLPRADRFCRSLLPRLDALGLGGPSAVPRFPAAEPPCPAFHVTQSDGPDVPCGASMPRREGAGGDA